MWHVISSQCIKLASTPSTAHEIRDVLQGELAEPVCWLIDQPAQSCNSLTTSAKTSLRIADDANTGVDVGDVDGRSTLALPYRCDQYFQFVAHVHAEVTNSPCRLDSDRFELKTGVHLCQPPYFGCRSKPDEFSLVCSDL